MATTTYLVTVSGPDRPGIAASLFAAVSPERYPEVEISDIAQITIRGYLVLCVEITLDDATAPETIQGEIANAGVRDEGVQVSVVRVEPEEFLNGKRLLLTVLAPAVSTEALGVVFAAMASCGATCERIVHLASYPVDCYELVVRGPNHATLREVLTQAARQAGLDVAVHHELAAVEDEHLDPEARIPDPVW